jgi:HEAT repeat protein
MSYTTHPDYLELQPRLQHTDATVRRIALIELADLEEPELLPWLINTLRNDLAAEVRAEAASRLASWEDADVVDALAQALTDGNRLVRDAAAHSLTELKTQQAGQRLLPWASHADTFVRTAALRALRELRLPDSFAPALAALQDDNAALRREAVSVLGWLKNPAALPALAELAATDTHAEVRRAATGALGFAEDDSVLKALLATLSDPEWQVREEAASTLGKLRLAAALPQLIEALDDDYWQVRLRAARALGRLKNPAALSALIGLFTHAISNLRKEAAIALGELGLAAALPALAVAEQDGDPEVRKAARLAIERIRLLQSGVTP